MIVFDKILSLDPKNVDALYNKSVVLDNLGNHVEAKLVCKFASKFLCAFCYNLDT